MRTAYLHIGAPKAGSTTIQGFLGDFREALAATGLDVPDFGQDDVIKGPLALSGALSREKDPARPATEPWRWLDGHLAATSADICVSREGLCNHFAEPAQLAFAKDFFDRHGCRLKLIAYVRDHVGYLNAAYAQQAKKFRVAEPFEAWVEGAVGLRRFAYWQRFKPILERPEIAFSVRPLQQVAQGGLVDDFCAEIDRPGFDASGFDETPHRNATPGPKSIAAALIIGRAMKERGIDPDGDQSLHGKFQQACEARGWDDTAFFGPDEELGAWIEAAFANADEKLARRAWGVAWTDVAPRTRRPRNVFDMAIASPRERAEVEEVARGILDRAEKTPFWRRLAALPQRSA